MTNTWSLTAEFLALILIIVLALHYYDKKLPQTLHSKTYWFCLLLSCFSIILNLISTWMLYPELHFSRQLNLAVNTVYFLSVNLLCAIMARYLFQKLLEHVYDDFCIRRATAIVSGLFFLYLPLLIANLKTGWIFSIDANGIYHRGILNRSGYWIMLLETILLLFCYFRHRSSVGKQMTRLLKIMPPLLLLLVLFQYFHPEILLNGTLIALIDLLLFINFQNHKVEIDPLTELGNRASFLNEITLRLAGRQTFHVTLVNFPHFQQVNLKYGHKHGDEFLYIIARWLEHTFQGGRIFRFSNVTFGIVCPFLSAKESALRVEKVQTRFQKEWAVGNCNYILKTAVCDLVHQQEEWNPSQLMEFLEYTLHQARKAESRYCHFSPTIAADVVRKKYLLEYIKSSIAKKHFEVWFQPVYCLSEERFCSAEALLRLQDVDGTFIPPAEFIPLAEESGLIDQLGAIVLDQVCCFLHAHADLPLDSISINLSMPQFLSPDLKASIQKVLHYYNVPVQKLKIELTEQTIVNDMQCIRHIMTDMAAAGFSFYLDDFGVGYSNLSCMIQLPFECIKFDKSLIDGLLSDPKNRLTLKTLTELFHCLGMSVVAEGAESAEQCSLLADLKADRIQGYYYARPMTAENLASLLKGGC